MAIYKRTWYMIDGTTKEDEVDLPLATHQRYEQDTKGINGVARIVAEKVRDTETINIPLDLTGINIDSQ